MYCKDCYHFSSRKSTKNLGGENFSQKSILDYSPNFFFSSRLKYIIKQLQDLFNILQSSIIFLNNLKKLEK